MDMHVISGSLGRITIKVSSYSNILTESISVHIQNISITLEPLLGMEHRSGKSFSVEGASSVYSEGGYGDVINDRRLHGLHFLAGVYQSKYIICRIDTCHTSISKQLDWVVEMQQNLGFSLSNLDILIKVINVLFFLSLH